MLEDRNFIREKCITAEIGRRLHITCIELNETQEQMSDTLGISTAYYGKVEKGGYGFSLERLVITKEKLDMDINYFSPKSREGNWRLH